MKLFRFSKNGSVGLGMLDENNRHIDISAFGHDLGEAFLEKHTIDEIREWVIAHAASCDEIKGDIHFLSCISRPSKIVCVGLNYAKHARETGAEPPKEPVLFFKSTSALAGPNDDVVIPKNSVKTDWEVELAIVIGKKTSYVDEGNANDHILGYCLHNDYSEREFQIERGGQWDKGKGCDTFAPMGPYLVTKDEIKDPNDLHLWLELNGQRLQDSHTSDMIFKVHHLVSYISQFMTLLPGDVISTGTPEGVGMGQKPSPFYLKPGDVVRLGIEGLGIQTQKAVAYAH